MCEMRDAPEGERGRGERGMEQHAVRVGADVASPRPLVGGLHVRWGWGGRPSRAGGAVLAHCTRRAACLVQSQAQYLGRAEALRCMRCVPSVRSTALGQRAQHTRLVHSVHSTHSAHYVCRMRTSLSIPSASRSTRPAPRRPRRHCRHDALCCCARCAVPPCTARCAARHEFQHVPLRCCTLGSCRLGMQHARASLPGSLRPHFLLHSHAPCFIPRHPASLPCPLFHSQPPLDPGPDRHGVLPPAAGQRGGRGRGGQARRRRRQRGRGRGWGGGGEEEEGQGAGPFGCGAGDNAGAALPHPLPPLLQPGTGGRGGGWRVVWCTLAGVDWEYVDGRVACEVTAGVVPQAAGGTACGMFFLQYTGQLAVLVGGAGRLRGKTKGLRAPL